jgi:hypothetical protein
MLVTGYWIVALVVGLLGRRLGQLSPIARGVHLVAQMPDWLIFPLFPAVYFALMRWVLPKFGISTCCMPNTCETGSRCEKKGADQNGPPR